MIRSGLGSVLVFRGDTMPKPIEEMDPQTREQVWNMAGRIQWTAEDWKTFHKYVTLAFATIVFRHAKERISNGPETIGAEKI